MTPPNLTITTEQVNSLPLLLGIMTDMGIRDLIDYRPLHATTEIVGWVEAALAHADAWVKRETVDPRTGEVQLDAVVDPFAREQTWQHPTSAQRTTWTERVLVVRAAAYQARLRQLREQALARLTADLLQLTQPPARGRKRYAQEADLATVVAKRIAEAKLEGRVQTTLAPHARPDGTRAWGVAAVWVDLPAWQAMVDRLGWQVYVTNTTPAQYDVSALVTSYHQQPVHERSFSRLKTRNLQLCPVFVRDETRIMGLVWLQCLALRVLVLTEQRLRTAMQAQGQVLVGLNPASQTHATSAPDHRTGDPGLSQSDRDGRDGGGVGATPCFGPQCAATADPGAVEPARRPVRPLGSTTGERCLANARMISCKVSNHGYSSGFVTTNACRMW